MTPDNYIRWYYERRDAGAPALNIVDSEGRVYRQGCSKCPSTIRHPTRDGGFACGRCGAPWPYDDVFLLKGEVTKAAHVRGRRVYAVPQRRADESERRLSTLVQVGTLLHRMLSEAETAISMRIYVLSVMGMTVAEITRTAPERLKLPKSFPVSESSIKRIIRSTRDRWATALDEAGLLR